MQNVNTVELEEPLYKNEDNAFSYCADDKISYELEEPPFRTMHNGFND